MAEARNSRSPATIRHVAQRAGVSVSTVSRVASGHPDVHPTTRARVRRAMDDLHYRPSALARALILGRAKILGLLVSDVTNPFYPELLHAIESTARGRSYTIILSSTEDDPVQSADALGVLRDYQVEGIIHASVRLDDPILDQLAQGDRPVVFVNRTAPAANASSVTVDNRAGASLATRHLLDLGRHSLVHLGGPAWASNAVERRDGFLDTIRGLDIAARVVEVGFMVDEARERIRQSLSESPVPDAIFAVNDSIAIAAMEEIVGRGLRIPHDVAVIGFDDTLLSASHFIQLSTISDNVQEMGRSATRILISHLEGDTAEWPQQIVLPPRLIVRGSTVPTRDA